MKMSYNFVAILLALLTLSSCGDFLNIVQEGEVPTDDIDFTDPGQMYAPVSGVYADARRKMTQWEIWPLLNVRGDEVTKGGGSAADQGDYLNIETFNYAAAKGFWALNNSWEAFYKVVYTTYYNEDLLNRFVVNLSNESDLALAEQYRAEIIFHRALAYYFIEQLWGEAPIVNPENVNDVFLYRATNEKLIDHIIEQLDYCIDQLPATQPVHTGAVTKYTAMTLKAKLALRLGDFATVKSLTDEIINANQYQLVAQDEYYDLFKIPGKLSSESIYEFQFTDFGNGDGQQIYGGAWFQHQGPRNTPAPVNGWGFMMLQKGYLDFLNQHGNNGERDQERWDLAVLESGVTTKAGDEIGLFEPSFLPVKAHYNGKAYTPSNQLTPGRPNYGANNNIRLLRYVDVLLMNAEAKVRIGGDAASPLNAVRTRVGLEPINNPTLDQILDERRAELSCEWGDRFNDLVRTGKASELLEGFVKGESEYLPIPVRQEDLNPRLLEPAR
ncbi:membrane protein [Persicobacter diffluens]|uniref:Membrane protein n=2 Tax=Persicobacter diffluens TaxID=981 RepID=A0AAN4W120_9BACT|nr:membrane protein [Persicobacter diffluens]